MKEGQRVYHVPSLFEPATPGKVLRLERFKGKIAWIEMQTGSGKIIADYAAKFSTVKPITYEIK